jgi:hypothetical protein
VSAGSFTAAAKAPVAAWWERLAGAEERWRVVIDGKPVDDVVCSQAWQRQPPELSPDGRHVAYVCPVREPVERVFVVADGRRYGPYWDAWAYVWSDDGAHLAYGAAEESPGSAWRYYVDGEARSAAVSSVWRPRLEPGTGRLAWEMKQHDRARGTIGFGRRAIASFDEVIAGPSFLRRGVVTWVIRRGRWLTRVDVPTG